MEAVRQKNTSRSQTHGTKCALKNTSCHPHLEQIIRKQVCEEAQAPKTNLCSLTGVFVWKAAQYSKVQKCETLGYLQLETNGRYRVSLVNKGYQTLWNKTFKEVHTTSLASQTSMTCHVWQPKICEKSDGLCKTGPVFEPQQLLLLTKVSLNRSCSKHPLFETRVPLKRMRVCRVSHGGGESKSCNSQV